MKTVTVDSCIFVTPFQIMHHIRDMDLTAHVFRKTVISFLIYNVNKNVNNKITTTPNQEYDTK